MKLIYLSEANLRDRLLIRDLVFNFKIKEQALVVHSSFNGTIRDTRFVTKRLSSLFSEAMVYNNAFSSDQRNFISRNDGGGLSVQTDSILRLIEPIQMIILGPIIKQDGEAQLIDAEEIVQAIRYQMDISELFVFPDNPLSPLGGKSAQIESQDEYEGLVSVFEEEKGALDRAFRLRPARIILPKYLNGDS